MCAYQCNILDENGVYKCIEIIINRVMWSFNFYALLPVVETNMWTLITLLMACRPSIQLKITHPADVTIDPSVTKIAVVGKF